MLTNWFSCALSFFLYNFLSDISRCGKRGFFPSAVQELRKEGGDGLCQKRGNDRNCSISVEKKNSSLIDSLIRKKETTFFCK